jgi:hypothetical protein
VQANDGVNLNVAVDVKVLVKVIVEDKVDVSSVSSAAGPSRP